MRLLVLFLLLGLMAAGCEKGELLENQPPETRLFVDEINLAGPDRLNTVVRLHWSGEDPDGYVKGYELGINGGDWRFTPATDSTFRFDIPEGSDTTDILFRVRAIDRFDLADPTPAELTVPIRNSPPTMRIDSTLQVPDSVYSIFSVLWNVDDLDGLATLDSLFIRVNQGPWYGLPTNLTTITLRPTAPDQPGVQAAEVLSGANALRLPRLIDGLEVGGENQLFVKARDIAGAESPPDSTPVFYLRPQGSDLLVIDAHGDLAADTTYRNLLARVYPNHDRRDLNVDRPPLWSPTFGLQLALYDKVFWYNDAAEITGENEQLFLEIASNELQRYLNGGGKLLVTAAFPNRFSDPETGNTSSILGFSPMDSLSTSPGQARIPTNAKVDPVGRYAGLLDTLVCSSFITGADPFFPKDTVNNLLRANLVTTGGWSGPATIAAQTTFTNGETNQVFVSVELHKLNADPAALEAFFRQVLLTDFNW
jgi:hypothetical protein